MKQIVLATGNMGKVKEFSTLFEHTDLTIKPQSDFQVPDIPETGTTFVENAIIKARHACALTGLPSIADDSGLAVDALNGAPGIYSSRFAGTPTNNENNIDKLLSELHNIDNRRARFLCILVYMKHKDDPTPIICQGEWEGEILQERLGDGGFGYDPIFWLPDQNKSAAQLDKATKNAISHRGKALKTLFKELHLASDAH